MQKEMSTTEQCEIVYQSKMNSIILYDKIDQCTNESILQKIHIKTELFGSQK